jgi:hypothetical protein
MMVKEYMEQQQKKDGYWVSETAILDLYFNSGRLLLLFLHFVSSSVCLHLLLFLSSSSGSERSDSKSHTGVHNSSANVLQRRRSGGYR